MLVKAVVLTVFHKHGIDVSVGPTVGQARIALYKYVEAKWPAWKTIPKSKPAAIEEYFSNARKEHYKISSLVDDNGLSKRIKKAFADYVMGAVADAADTAGINNHVGYDDFIKKLREDVNGECS